MNAAVKKIKEVDAPTSIELIGRAGGEGNPSWAFVSDQNSFGTSRITSATLMNLSLYIRILVIEPLNLSWPFNTADWMSTSPFATLVQASYVPSNENSAGAPTV